LILGILLLLQQRDKPSDITRLTTPIQISSDLLVEEDTTWREFTSSEVLINKGIFYFETNGLTYITNRQACALESALLHNPDRLIFLIITSGGNTTTLDIIENRVYSQLLGYENFRLRFVNLVTLFKRSALWNWFIYSNWHKSESRSEQLRLALSLLFLMDYGGTTLSFGVIHLKRLPYSIGECESERVGVDVLSFDREAQFVHYVVDALAKNYSSIELNSRGFTTTLLELCKTETLKEMRFQDCRVLPWNGNQLAEPSVYCPIEKKDHWIIFDEKRVKLARRKVDSKSVTLNIWLKYSAPLKVWASSQFKSLMFELGSAECPLIFQSSNSTL